MFSFISYEHLIIDSQVWEHMSIIPDLKMCRQEDLELRGSTSLDYVRPYLTQTKIA